MFNTKLKLNLRILHLVHSPHRQVCYIGNGNVVLSSTVVELQSLSPPPSGLKSHQTGLLDASRLHGMEHEVH